MSGWITDRYERKPPDDVGVRVDNLVELLDRADMLKEQARILMREMKRASDEGIDRPLPESRFTNYKQPRLTPAQWRDRDHAWLERSRAKGSRASAKARGASGKSRLRPAAILEKSENRCYLCGCELHPDKFDIEHIIPISWGGTHTDENLAAACPPCNNWKSDKFIAFDVETRAPRFVRRP